jgi:hypothetical protein
VGRRFRLEERGASVEVVGVVDNAQYILLGEQPRPVVYLPLLQRPNRYTYMVIRSRGGDPSGLVPDVRRVLSHINPSVLLYGTRTMASHLDQGIALFFVNVAATLATAIGLLGLLQTIVGLYGVLAYTVAQRSREIGIRMALGARAVVVIREVLRQGSLLVLAGLVIGTGIAVGITRLMGALLYGVSPTDGLAYGGSLLLVGTLAIVSSFVPAWRAARTAPAAVLRSD